MGDVIPFDAGKKKKKETAETTIEGKPLSRIQEIVWHEAEAARLQSEADEHKWTAAKLIWEELQGPPKKSQRKLADEIGKSQPHVKFMAATWEYFGGISDNLGYQERPPFNEAYHSAKVRGTREDRPEADELRIPSIETLAEAIDNDPFVAEKVTRALQKAAEMRKDRLGDDPDHGRQQRGQRMLKASQEWHKIMKGINIFVETFRPEPGQKAAAEKLATALEQAAAMIRQRVSKFPD